MLREALLSGRVNALLVGCIAALLLAAPVSAGAMGEIVRADSGSWTDYVRALWPIFIVVAGLIVTGLILGLATRFPTVVAFNGLKDRVRKLEADHTDHDQRIKATESYCAGTPSRLELQEDIYEASERLKGVETELVGIGRQIGTMNTYLHSLIDRGLHRS